MTYILATTESCVRWYVVDMEKKGSLKSGEYRLVDVLDLTIVPGFGNKETAKKVAVALGLKTWNYVQIKSTYKTYTF